MKKVLLFVAVVAAISFASCKKDHTCTCTTTSTAAGASTTTDVTDYGKSSKSADKSACAISTNAFGRRQIWSKTEHHDAIGLMPAYTTTETCVLK